MGWQATDIPEGKRGDTRITKKTLTMEDYQWQIMRRQHHPVPPGTRLTRLIIGNELMMSDTRWEKQTCQRFLQAARGDVLIFGLGLGCVVREVQDNPDVRSVLVIENNRNVIKLVAPHSGHPKVTIAHGNAFTFVPARSYDCIWIDIWSGATCEFTKERRSLVGRLRKFKKAGGFLVSVNAAILGLLAIFVHLVRIREKSGEVWTRLTRRNKLNDNAKQLSI
jgi:hypothetical protein